jgi:hypothetical protein
MSTIRLTEEQLREARARAYWAWAKDNRQTALAHFHEKPPAMFAGGKYPESWPKLPRKPKPPKGRRRRNPRGTLSGHNAMMRRLHGKNWRSKGRA